MKSKFVQALASIIFGYGLYAINICHWIWYDEEIPARVKELAEQK
jgi:hypothetical protein